MKKSFHVFFTPPRGGVGRIYAPKAPPPRGDTTGSPLYNVTKMAVSVPTAPKSLKMHENAITTFNMFKYNATRNKLKYMNLEMKKPLSNL